jgi:hypothetical protein
MEDVSGIKINFILTTARTGSTLLTAIFNSNPVILSTSEEPFAQSLYDGYAGINNWTQKVKLKFIDDFFLFAHGNLEGQFSSKEEMLKMFSEYKGPFSFQTALRLSYLSFMPGKDKTNIKCVVDKQLLFHNRFRQISEMFPESKFIILLRDPRDNVLAKLRMFERQKKKLNYVVFSIKWKKVFELLIAHAQKLGTQRALYVKYEDLITAPENEIKRICSFLEVPFNPQMLEHDQWVKKRMESDPVFVEKVIQKDNTNVHEGFTKKMYKEKIGFWKGGLTKEQANMVWTINRDMALKAGYVQAEDFVKQSKGFKFLLYSVRFFVLEIVLVKFYYILPFGMRRIIKKIKKGK